MKSRCRLSVSLCWIGLLVGLFGSLQPMSSLTWQIGSSECSLINNPVLQHLRLNGVGMLHQASKTNSHCKAEWGSHGTCCDPSQAVRFIDSFDRKTQRSFDSLKESFDATIDRMKSLLDSSKHFEKLRAKDLVHQTKQSIDDFRKLSGTAFNKEKSCFASIRKIVGATVCAACSTRSSSFFGNSKVHISEDDCRTTILTVVTDGVKY